MAHTLEQFAADCHKLIAAVPGPKGRQKVRELLRLQVLDSKADHRRRLGVRQSENGMVIGIHGDDDTRLVPPLFEQHGIFGLFKSALADMNAIMTGGSHQFRRSKWDSLIKQQFHDRRSDQ